MRDILSILAASILTQNIALTFILGMCPIIAISKSLKTAFGMGVSVLFVVTLTAMINWLIYEYVLVAAGSEIISLLVFIIVIAATVQFLEMVLEKYVPFLHAAFGIYLPLITVNCVVLAVSLFMVIRHYNFIESTVFAFGSSAGWLLAIVTVASIREKLALIGDIPKGLRGAGIVMVILGILSLGFMGFAGMVG